MTELRPEVLERLLESYKSEGEPGGALRRYMEAVLPQIAGELKLGSGWNYKTLYLAVLEASARLLRIGKYRIYSLEKLAEAVRRKAADNGIPEGAPGFVHIILN